MTMSISELTKYPVSIGDTTHSYTFLIDFEVILFQNHTILGMHIFIAYACMLCSKIIVEIKTTNPIPMQILHSISLFFFAT